MKRFLWFVAIAAITTVVVWFLLSFLLFPAATVSGQGIRTEVIRQMHADRRHGDEMEYRRDNPPTGTMIGRYQLHSAGETLCRIDTATGQAWRFVSRHLDNGVYEEYWEIIFESLYESEYYVHLKKRSSGKEHGVDWDKLWDVIYSLDTGARITVYIDSIGYNEAMAQGVESIARRSV